MYYLPDSGAVLASHSAIRQAFPSVSFPSSMADIDLADFGVYPLVPTEPGHDPITQDATEGQPAQKYGQWTQTWVITDAAPDVVAQRQAQQREQDRAQIAARRYTAETAGITVNGMAIDTSRDSQSLITGTALQATIDATYTCRWKTASGFVDLTASQILSMAAAVRTHVQGCFDREAVLLDQLATGTLTPDMLEQGWPQ